MRKAALIVLTCACTQEPQLIPPPEAVGLLPGRAYPDAESPCYVMGENEITNQYLDHTRLLIGCPRALTQHLAAREAEGAQIVAYVERWALLSKPLDG